MANITIREPEELVDIAQKKGEEFSKKIKTHQLRNFYAGITQIRQDWKNKKGDNVTPEKISSRLVMLKPKLAYAAGRQASVRPFFEFISTEIDRTRSDIKILEEELSREGDQQKIEDAQAKILENFFTLIEGIVAYHKFYGGE